MNQQKYKAFTLVELIVVITILAILWTIAFISLQGYSRDSRDSVRISDISNMKTSLELFHLNAWKYPLPDNAETVTYSGGILWYQWTFGEQVVNNVSRNMSDVPKDPLMDKEYFYSVHNNKNQLQVLALLEWDATALNSIDTVQAGSLAVTPRLDGNYNGLFVKTSTHIVPVPSIMTAIDIPGTMELTQDTISSQITHLWDNIPEVWNVASNTGWLTDINLSVWTGSLTSDSSDADKVAAMDAIKGAYSGSSLANDGVIADILETSGTGSVTAMIDTVVLNTKGSSTATTTTNTESWPVASNTTQVQYSDITTSGNAISNWYWVAAQYHDDSAFDNGWTPWIWPTYVSMSWIDYIWQNFGSPQTISKVVFYANSANDTDRNIPSAIIQSSNDGSNWTSHNTITIDLTHTNAQTFDVTNPVSSQYWRLLANANTTNYGWHVQEIEFQSAFNYYIVEWDDTDGRRWSDGTYVANNCNEYKTQPTITDPNDTWYMYAWDTWDGYYIVWGVKTACGWTDITTTWNSISNGNLSWYPKEQAFDNGGNPWIWPTYQNISWIDYIGQNFWTPRTVNQVVFTIWNANDTARNITSALIQSSNDGSTWTTHNTMTIDISNTADQTFIVSNPVSAQYWRLLANANTTAYGWHVKEIQFQWF